MITQCGGLIKYCSNAQILESSSKKRCVHEESLTHGVDGRAASESSNLIHTVMAMVRFTCSLLRASWNFVGDARNVISGFLLRLSIRGVAR